MAVIDAMLQRMARQQGRQLTRDEGDLMHAASQPTQTQRMIQQMMQPVPPPQQPVQTPPPQTGATDPTGEIGNMMIGRAGETGKSSPAQEEQLVRMLQGRGMSEADARARVKGL